MAAAGLLAVPVSFVVSLIITRWFAPRVGPAFPIRVTWISTAVSAIALAAMLAARDATQIYIISFVANATNGVASMILPTALQSMSPPDLRARLLALQAIVSVDFHIRRARVGGRAVGPA